MIFSIGPAPALRGLPPRARDDKKDSRQRSRQLPPESPESQTYKRITLLYDIPDILATSRMSDASREAT